MRFEQDILLGAAGQSLRYTALEGKPSSVVSVRVFAWADGDDYETTGVLDGSPAISAVSGTVSAVSGSAESNPRLITVDDSSGFAAGQLYQITAADGRREQFELSEVYTGQLVARNPLHNSYPIGATIESTEITVSISDAWAATELADSGRGPNGQFRVRWVYVVAGATQIADTYFSLVRYPGRADVTPIDLDNARPGWLDSLPTDHRADQGRSLIEQAQKAVRLDLFVLGLADEKFANAEVMDELVERKAIELGEMSRYLSTSSQDAERFNMAKLSYQELLNGAAKLAANVPQRSDSGAASPIIPRSFTVR